MSCTLRYSLHIRISLQLLCVQWLTTCTNFNGEYSEIWFVISNLIVMPRYFPAPICIFSISEPCAKIMWDVRFNARSCVCQKLYSLRTFDQIFLFDHSIMRGQNWCGNMLSTKGCVFCLIRSTHFRKNCQSIARNMHCVVKNVNIVHATLQSSNCHFLHFDNPFQWFLLQISRSSQTSFLTITYFPSWFHLYRFSISPWGALLQNTRWSLLEDTLQKLHRRPLELQRFKEREQQLWAGKNSQTL